MSRAANTPVVPAPVGEAAIAWSEPCPTREAMWVRIRSEYEFGQLTVAAISRLSKLWDPEKKGVSGTSVTKRAKVGSWHRPAAQASLEQIRKRMAELGITDREVIGDAGIIASHEAMKAPPVPEPAVDERQQQLDAALARTLTVVRDHRSSLAKLRTIADALADKIEQAVINGQANIKVYTEGSGKNAVDVVTLDFLGPRESVADAFQKVAQAMSRIVPMERTAYGLNDGEGDNRAPLVIKIGGGLKAKFVQGPKPNRPAIEVEPS